MVRKEMMLKRVAVVLTIAALLAASLPLSALGADARPAVTPSPEDVRFPHFPRISTGLKLIRECPIKLDRARVEALSTNAISPLGDRLRCASRTAGRASDLTLTGSDVLLVDSDLSVLDITLSGNSILFVYNASRTVQLTMAGQLELRDNATLVLNHSKLQVDQLYDQQFSMWMYNTSHFYAFFSNVTACGYQWPGAMWDRSNLTIGGTEFCVNPSWFPVTLIQNASIYSAYSLFYSDIVHFDFPWVPLGSSIVLDHSAYFNIWLAVREGASADLTLPQAFAPVPVNWSFPGSFAVTNISYRIELNVSSPLLFATMQYRGGSIIVRDSPSFLGAFFIDNAATRFSGMREQHYADTTFPMQDVSLRLVNSTIFTWNFYASDGGNIAIDSSDVGEILCMGTGQATISNCNLDGKGGYVSCHGTSLLRIFNSTISPVVVSYENTVLEIQNSTIDFWWPTRVLASGNSLLRLIDVTLGKNVTLQVLDSGRLETWYHLDVAVKNAGTPAEGATVRTLYRPNGTLAGSAIAGPDGSASFLLPERTLTPGGRTFTNNFTVTAFRNASIASKDYTLKARENLTLELLNFVSGTSPADGENNVSLFTNITLNFSYAMDPVSPMLYITIVPLTSVSWSWDAPSKFLTLRPDGALSPLTNYTITVTTEAKTASGLQLPEALNFTFTTAARPPGPPTGLVAAPGNNSVQLSWSLPLDNGGAPVEGYRLYRRAGNSTTAFLAASSTPDYLDGNLTAGTMYYYAVSALNSAGEGNRSDLVQAIPGTVPSVPLELNATAGDGVVSLRWLAPAEDGGFPVTIYTIYRVITPNIKRLVMPLGNVLSFNDTGLTNGVMYHYQVSATNSRGEGPLSIEVNATPRSPYTAPGKPQNLQVLASNGQVRLSWGAPLLDGGCPVTGYRVYRSNTSSGFSFLKSSALNSTNDDGLGNGQAYYYQVTAVNDIGEGPASANASAVPWSVPSAPRNLTVALKGSKVLLTWEAPADDGGFPIRSYKILRGLDPQNLTVLSTVTSSTYTDGNVSAGKKYYYQVAAVSDKGEGPATAVRPVIINAKPPADQGSLVPAVVVIALIAGALVGGLFIHFRRKHPPA